MVSAVGTRVPGSSPLARGGRHLPLVTPRWAGLIPARAGRTPIPARSTRGTRAHPRSRGEDRRRVFRYRCRRGSSPLARGGLMLCPSSWTVSGLIPARAGRTVPAAPRPRGSRAHPRSRGEDARMRALLSNGQGSSPLARGGQVTQRWGHRFQGLIPARAGRTWVVDHQVGDRRAHPRSRGEDVWSALSGHRNVGSSPLARGGPGPGQPGRG